MRLVTHRCALDPIIDAYAIIQSAGETQALKVILSAAKLTPIKVAARRRATIEVACIGTTSEMLERGTRRQKE